MSNLSTPSSSPPPGRSRRPLRTCARRCERGCCTVATYFPLAFVYSLTTWAVWVEASIGFGDTAPKHHIGSVKTSSIVGVCLYLLLNASYTIAVFTDPGSPKNDPKTATKHNYSSLPTTEPISNGPAFPTDYTTVTVSSRGGSRFCKKCQCPKPDRSHHCSTCGRCVLKMDHHCPWLATCLGLHNYKAFALFLIYTTLFCWVCLGSSSYWMWTELFADNRYLEEFAPINIILLAVVAGVIGLVLTGFTAWHLFLVSRGQTTIECLEKTRYLSGVRNRVERNRQEHVRHDHQQFSSDDITDRVRRAGEQLLEFHANAVPGAFRYEEGEEHTSPTPVTRPPNTYSDYPSSDADSPAQQALRRAHQQPKLPPKPPSSRDFERDREADRYAEYLDDRDSEKLPNAFDLGWRQNLRAVFGLNPLLWALPLMNSPGDGWRWETSEKWTHAKQELEQRQKQEHDRAYNNQPQPKNLNGGHNGSYDEEIACGNVDPRSRYEQGGLSMEMLNSRGRGRERAWGGRFRKDVDRSGQDGELDSFEVSSDDEDDRARDRFQASAWGSS